MTDLLADLVLDARPPCITEHPDFANVCLCRAVLTVSMHDHRYHYMEQVTFQWMKIGIVIQL